MTRVIVPYVPGKLHPSVVPAIERDGHRAELRICPDGEPYAYWRILLDEWRPHRREPLVIVEQDIEPAPGQLDDLIDCGMPWCAASYPVYWGGIAEVYGGPWGLGFVKFSPELMTDYPELIAADVPGYANAECAGADSGRHWLLLDSAVSTYLRMFRGRMIGEGDHPAHRHLPDVTHHHQYDYEGAYLVGAPGVPAHIAG